MKSASCVTAEQIKAGPGAGLATGARGGKDTCKVSDQKISGSTVSWKMACAAPQNMNGTAELVFKGDTYTGTMNMTTPQGAMTMKMSGKRLGECAP
jgi:hypothetical protein